MVMVQGYESSIITASTVIISHYEQMVTKLIQNFHLGSSFSGSRFFHRLRDKKNYVFKRRMNKLVLLALHSIEKRSR